MTLTGKAPLLLFVFLFKFHIQSRSLYTLGDIDDVIIQKFLGYCPDKVSEILKEKQMGWNTLMRHFADEIFNKGFAQSDVLEALGQVKLVCLLEYLSHFSLNY